MMSFNKEVVQSNTTTQDADQILLIQSELLEEKKSFEKLLAAHIARHAEITARLHVAQHMHQSNKRVYAAMKEQPNGTEEAASPSTSLSKKTRLAPNEQTDAVVQNSPSQSDETKTTKSAGTLRAATLASVCQSPCLLPKADARARLEHLVQERVRLHNHCAALTGAPADKMRAILSYVRAISTRDSPAPELTRAMLWGAALRAAFRKPKETALVDYDQIAAAARSLVTEEERQRLKGNADYLLFAGNTAGNLIRFDLLSGCHTETPVEMLFCGQGDVQVPFEVAFYTGIVDASRLSISAATRPTLREQREATENTSERWLRTLRGQGATQKEN